MSKKMEKQKTHNQSVSDKHTYKNKMIMDEKNKQYQFGNTTYIVKNRNTQNAKTDIVGQVKRLILNDCTQNKLLL